MSLNTTPNRIRFYTILALCMTWLLASCAPESHTGEAPMPTAPDHPQFVRQGIREVLSLYHRAHRQEDIDLLDEALNLDADLSAATRQNDDPDSPEFSDLTAFRRLFRSQDILGAAFIDLDGCLPDDAALQTTADRFLVTCFEAISAEDPLRLTQRTQVFRTTFDIVRETDANSASFHIASVRLEGPLLEVSMRGQMLPGRPVRVEARASGETLQITGATVETPETLAQQNMQPDGDRWQAVVVAPTWSDAESGIEPIRVSRADGELLVRGQPQPLRVRITTSEGIIEAPHAYRMQEIGAGAVEAIEGTRSTRLFAVAVNPNDDTVWSGGDERGRLYRVAPGTSTVEMERELLNRPGRVTDLSLDEQGRAHAVVFPPLRRGEHVMVVDGDTVCSSVNVFDDAYPFKAASGDERPLPSTRTLAGSGQAMWLFGSDGGVAEARLPQSFSAASCALEAYKRPLQRPVDALPANTVPALAQTRDGQVWLGTILGVTRFQDEAFHPVPFRREIKLDAAAIETLEMYFRELAQALFDARPVSTTEIAGVPFNQELIKEEVVSSLVEDSLGRLWVGTWGGGLWRIESEANTLHLTRQQGLLSNVVFALAAGLDGELWVASEQGVSRLRESPKGGLTITNYTARDGMPVRNGRNLPVRDVAVDSTGTAWLATDGGLYRIAPTGGQIEGAVRDAQHNPIAGAEVELAIVQEDDGSQQATPYGAVTDSQGSYALVNLPAGRYQLRIAGRLASGGPYGSVQRQIELQSAEAIREDFALSRISEGVQLRRGSGDNQSGIVKTLLEPFVVKVEDAQGRPRTRLPVTFTVTEGTGIVSTKSVITNGDGQAETALKIGEKAGRVRVEARLGEPPEALEVRFFAEARPDPNTAQLRPISGEIQTIEADGFSVPLVARLEDAFGNPFVDDDIQAQQVEGETVNFLSAQHVATDAQGIVTFTLQAESARETVVIEAAALSRPDVLTQFRLIVPKNSVGRNPQSLATADLNGDDRLDIVTANADSADVSVLLGLGDGTFTSEIRFGVGRSPLAVSLGDANGDDRLDIVTANADSGDVSVLLGLGDGTFTSATFFIVGAEPRAVSLGDVNGDDRLDIVTANGDSGDVSVLLGLGDGAFEAETRVGLGSFPEAVSLGDVNGDNRLDIVTANGDSDDVSVLLGLGDGTFTSETPFVVGDFPEAVLLGDVNGDNRLDIVTANGFSDDVSVLLGLGDGTFTPQTRFDVGGSPRALSLGHVNGDDILDIVTANWDSADVSVLLGLGDGTFEAGTRFVVDGFLDAVSLGDVNGDDRLDIVTDVAILYWTP